MISLIRKVWKFLDGAPEVPRHSVIDEVRAKADEVAHTAGREKEAMDRVGWARQEGAKVVDGLRGSICEMARRLGE
jgi:hypothetical protein